MKMGNKAFSVYIIGESALTLACAELFLRKGCTILGIISDRKNIIKWAYNKDIALFSNLSEFKSNINPKSFDYLFSIVNHHILDEHCLSMPRLLCINYHDSPLPKYAGIHATAWAILNDEKEHGITWHSMDSKIDHGSIMRQVIFKLDKNFTTHDLNIRCYEKAIEQLQLLIDDLLESRCHNSKQNLNRRTYYPLSQKPKYFGIISKDQTCNAILRLFKATQYGNYNNTFCSSKIIIEGNVFIPTSLKLLSAGVQRKRNSGRILKITDAGICIAVQDGVILIGALKDLNGEVYSPKELVEEFSLKEDHYLPTLNPNVLDSIKTLAKNSSNVEYSLVNSFKEVNTLNTPLFNGGVKYKYQNYSEKRSINQDLVHKMTLQYQVDVKTLLVALFLTYLYKANNYRNQAILLQDETAQKPLYTLVRKLFSTKFPLITEFKPAHLFRNILEKITYEINTVSQQPPYSQDIFIRYKDIEHNAQYFSIVIVDSAKASFQESKPDAIELIIDIDKSAFIVPSISNPNTPLASFFSKMEERLNKMMLIYLENDQAISNYHLVLSTDCLSPIDKEINIDIDTFTSLHGLFEQIAFKYPKNRAVGYKNHSLSYEALNNYANFIANTLLQKTQHKKHRIIAICLQRGIDFIASIIGTLKAGFTYVPIDATQPAEHIAYILHDTDPEYLITSKTLVDLFPKGIHLTLIDNIQAEANRFDLQKSTPNPPKEINKIAYIIYTSGTTGNPKGVQVTHHNLLSLLKATDDCFSFNEKDVWTLLHALSFDFSVWEMWRPLTKGSALIIVPTYISQSPRNFLDFILQENITVLNQTPSYFNELVKFACPSTAEPKLSALQLRYIIFGGERLNVSSIRTWADQKGFTNPKLINMYGITETTVHASYQEIKKHDVTQNAYVPIGKPLKNLHFHILDKHRQPVQPGLPGELYISGHGVSLGYWNNLEETQKRYFKISILGHDEFVYKTGDQVIDQRGGLQYLGRLDNQVKIRGFRIELDAINSVLMEQVEIKQSCSVVKYNKNQLPVIVTYLVLDKSVDLNEKDLKKQLSSKLPDYMIPTHFVKIKDIPLTRNYKVDMSLLPDPTVQKSFDFKHKAYNSVQKIIISIWQEILGVNEIHLDDNFFDLGGNSFSLSRTIIALKKAFDVDVCLTEFFKKPTLSYIEKFVCSSTKNQPNKQDYTFLNSIYLNVDIFTQKIKPIQFKRKPSILLTGSTSFFGLYLIKYLSSSQDCTIYALIRGNDIKTAYDRLQNEYKNLFHTNMKENIIPVWGDLEKDFLGLSEVKFTRLAKEIDLIIHSGALVNHILNFEHLKNTNVNSTTQLIQLATTVKLKSIHYISSLSADIDQEEDFPNSLSNIKQLSNGYVQSKWVSEMLLYEAHQRGVPVTIHRPNWIVGDRKTKNFPVQNNHLTSFIKSCIQMGVAPEVEGSIDLLPVDFLAQVITKIVFNKSKHSTVYNYSNPEVIQWIPFVNWLKEHGYPINLIPYPAWLDQLLKIDSQNALYKFYPLYRRSEYPYVLRPYSVQHSHLNFDTILDDMLEKHPKIPYAELAGYIIDSFKRFNTLPTDRPHLEFHLLHETAADET